MNWLIKFEYIDPSNEGIYDGTQYLPEAGLLDVLTWVGENLPVDHLIKIEILGYSK